jgi:hypothetical protein
MNLSEFNNSLTGLVEQREKALQEWYENSRHIKNTIDQTPIDQTFMVSPVHGQPYRKLNLISKMAVCEHGRPFDNSTHIQNTTDQTYMVSPVHGQPFRRKNF